MQHFTDVKLEIFVPQEYALKIRDDLAKIGVGVNGNYDHCVAIHPVQGYFRPLGEPARSMARLGGLARPRNIKWKSIAGASW